MRSKLLRSKTLLSACLILVLMLGLAVVGMATAARADYTTATVGKPVCLDGGAYTFNDDSTQVTYTGDLSAYYIRATVANYDSGDISITLNTQQAAQVRILIFQAGDWGYNNVDVATWDDMVAGQAYTKTFNPAKYTGGAVAADTFDVTFSFKSATDVQNTVTFDSIAVVEHVAPAEPAKVAIGEWAAVSSNAVLHQVEKDGSIEVGETTYTGLKVSWDKTVAQYSYVGASVSDFDIAHTPLLHISFYTDHAMKLGVWDNVDNVDATKRHIEYAAGYHQVTFNLAHANLNQLLLYCDSGEAQDFEGTKTVVFDSIRFCGVAIKENVNNGDVFTVGTENGLSLQWSGTVSTWPSVVVPVANWDPTFDRYLVLDMSLAENATFRFFFNDGNHLDQWGSPVETSAFGVYTGYQRGRHIVCFDTSEMLTAGVIAKGDNKLFIYVHDSEAVAWANNTVTFNSIRFAGEAVTPVALTVDVDYTEKTVDFDDEKLEVSKAAGFDPLLEKGGAVEAGKLYIRSKADHAITAEIELKNAVLTLDNAPTPIRTDTSISYLHVTGYQFKFGDNGEWGDTRFWDGLELDTDYTVYIRKLASDIAFESNELKVTLQCDGEYIPVRIDLVHYESRNNFITVETAGGKTTLAYNAAGIGGNYYSVSFPVTDWKQGNRYLVLDLSFTETANLRFYLNGNKFDEWGNPVDGSAFTPSYTEYGKGRHLVCLDTASLNPVPNTEGDNKLIVFCDGGLNTSVSLAKQITINDVRFSQVSVESVSLTVDVDYLAGTLDFDDEKVEVSAAADFGTLLAKGASVSVGKLYIRSKADHAMSAEITLAKATVPEIKALVTATSISYEHLTGYQFKFGADGEWGTTALWENLTPDTEYTVYARIPATENSFASDEVELKVRTRSVPGGNTTPEENNSGCSCNGSVAAVSLPFAALLMAGCTFFLRRRRSAK